MDTQTIILIVNGVLGTIAIGWASKFLHGHLADLKGSGKELKADLHSVVNQLREEVQVGIRDIRDDVKDLGGKVGSQAVMLADLLARMAASEKENARMAEEVRLVRQHYHDLAGDITSLALRGKLRQKTEEGQG